MGETFVETYRGCEIWYLTPPHVPEPVYMASCIVGHFFTISAVKKRICEGQGGTWVSGACTFPPEPEEPELIETYRGVDIYWKPAINAFWAQVAVGSVAVGATLEAIKIEIDKILGALEPAPPDTWPWPLDAVQNWFEGLWNNVVSAPLAALNSFWTAHLLPKLEWVRDQIDLTVNWVYNQLKPIISDIATSVLNVWTSISTSISNMWTELATSITNIGSWIWSKINPVLTAITTKITDVWNGLSTAVGGVITSVTATITGVKDSILGEVAKKANDILNGISLSLGNVADSLWTAIGTGFNNVSTWISTSTGAIWDSVLGLAGDLLNGMATSLGTALSGFFDWMLKQLGWIAEMIGGAAQFVMSKLLPTFQAMIAGFMDLLTGALTPGSPPKEIAIAAQVLSGTLYDNQVKMLDEIHHSPSSYEELFKVAVQTSAGAIAAGGSALAAATAADQANPAKNPGFRPTVRELVYWSGIPAVTASIAVLPASVGLITPLRYWLNKRWMPMKPAADDIIRFSVREVYRPERREALLVNYPGEEYQDLMAFNGFLPVFAEHFWMAHWILPSISQLNEMLHRGHIDRSVWMKYVEYNDYIPEMIPKLEKIIYNPYTRVDIRRMWDMRVVTEEEVLENYKWLGYDDEHAQRMTLWTKIYTLESELRSRYSKGWLNAEQVRSELLAAGMPEQRIDEWVEKIVKSGQADRMTAEKDLTKTDILRLFKLNLMSDGEALGMLMDLGYDEDEASYMIQIQKYEPEIVLKELTMSQILKSYVNEIYTRNETKNALLEAGWSEQAAETLLKLEDIKLKDAQTVRMMEKELSRTDIVKGIKVGIIDANTGYEYLNYLGYSDWEIGFIFALEGIE